MTAGFLKITEAAAAELFLSRDDLAADGRVFGSVRLSVFPHASSVTLDDMKRVGGRIVFVTGLVHNTEAGAIIDNVEEVRGVY